MSAAADIRAARRASLRRTCLHEYAHLAVARHLGACGFVAVRAGAEAGHYAGHFQMYGELGDGDWRLVALAGALAECLDDDASVTAAAAHCRLASDAALLCGIDFDLAQGYGVADVERCLAIVRSQWASIEADAAEHVRSRFSD